MNWLLLAERLDLAFLQEPQELGLNIEWQVADLVDEERSSSGGSNHAHRIRNGASESSPLVAEQVAL